MANKTTATKALATGLLGAVVTALTAVNAALADNGLDRNAIVQIVVAFLVAAGSTAVTYYVSNQEKVPPTTTDPAPAPEAPEVPADAPEPPAADSDDPDGSKADLAALAAEE
jgi:hypothetical protein